MTATQITMFRQLLEALSCRYGRDQILTPEQSRVQLLLTEEYTMRPLKWWPN